MIFVVVALGGDVERRVVRTDFPEELDGAICVGSVVVFCHTSALVYLNVSDACLEFLPPQVDP